MRAYSAAPDSELAGSRPPNGLGYTGRAFVVLAALWTLFIVALAVWEDRRGHANALALARTEAISNFEKDLVYRRWATKQGGVYVPITVETQPNPYLAHIPERDLTTPSGRKLTLVNPAYMTRQVHELGASTYGAHGHITSLKPIRPLNKPDAWETKALQAFEAGVPEVTSVELIDTVQYFRFMRPMRVEAGCLKCHEQQGYKLGDIRGGLSISVPFAPYHDAALSSSTSVFVRSIFIWILGMAGLGFTHRRIRRDVRKREAAEAEQARLQRQLAQAQKLETVGRLAGGVAHDFNNMLTVIRGYTEVALSQVPPTDPLHDDLNEILSATERSTDLTRQLLAFARKQTVVPRVLAVNAAIVETRKMLERLIGESIRIQLSLAAEPWRIRMDPSQIDQMLVNLCLNARDAISGTGTVTISTENMVLSGQEAANDAERHQGEFVQLTVTDDGSGMDPETLAHVFEPFFTTKSTGRGTGLGLATVHGIVTQNGGFINVKSARGQGTSFSVFLPRYVGSEDTAPARDRDVPGAHPRATILLVEDEPAILEITRRLLDEAGYTVLAAQGPSAALDMNRAHNGAIDLCVTDVVMPEMNGRELADALLATHPRMKRLYMSGYTADVIGTHGVLAEDTHFVQKPFSQADLLQKVREALAGE